MQDAGLGKQEILRRNEERAMVATWQEPKWYALFVRSNQEKKVAQRLQHGEVEHFLPCYDSLRQWKDRRVKLAMPLFPGYLFVKLPLVERMKVLTVPNVVSLVGAGNSYSEIPEEEIAWIRRGAEEGKAQPHPHLSVGQRVVVRAGAMAGVQGILLRMSNSTRVVVSLDSINRAFVIEVDGASIEPVAPGMRVASA